MWSATGLLPAPEFLACAKCSLALVSIDLMVCLTYTLSIARTGCYIYPIADFLEFCPLDYLRCFTVFIDLKAIVNPTFKKTFSNPSTKFLL